MEKNKSENIVWHHSEIRRQDREALLGQKGVLLWFTGLSGSGKSTVANALEKKLVQRKRVTYLLDGDNIRHGLNGDLGFDAKSRKENIRRIGEVGRLFVDAGLITITAFISPFQEDRNSVRNLLGDRFVEVFVDCPMEECEKRDPKGLYKKAREGNIADFTGIHSPYERPENPEITIRTDIQQIEDCADEIIGFLEKQGFIWTA
ncbi:MAG: adenylyl-sulfate kinase [Bacillota bacterium]